jgi:hemolysin III
MSTAEYPPSVGEEIANSVSHGLGLVAAIAAVPVLVIAAVRDGNPAYVVGMCVFAASVVSLYLASTLYHALRHEKAKALFRLLDHGAIFLLIAGTYTPFTLGVLHGPWGWTLLVIIWVLALIGLAMKVMFGTRHSWVSIVLLCGDGLVGGGGGQADVVAHPVAGSPVDLRWGCGLHRRPYFFRG